MSSITYSLSGSFPTGQINQPLFINQILTSAIVTVLIGVKVVGNVVTVTFATAPSGGEITILNAIVAAHLLPIDADVVDTLYTNFVVPIIGQTGSILDMNINASVNNVTNISNQNIRALAGIDATKIANGSVSNTAFQFISGLTGPAVDTTGVQTLNNKTFVDSTTFFSDNLVPSKLMQFQVSGLTGGTTVTLTVPSASTTLIGGAGTNPLDFGMVVFDGTTTGLPLIKGIGIRHFGANFTDPTGGTNPGNQYYNTTINQNMFYDSSRSKWLSTATFCESVGRAGNTTAGSFYRRNDTITMTTTKGPILQKGTFVGISFTTNAAVAHTVEVLIAGTAITELASGGAASASSFTLNADFSQGIMSVRNKAGSTTAVDTQCLILYKLRA